MPPLTVNTTDENCGWFRGFKACDLYLLANESCSLKRDLTYSLLSRIHSQGEKQRNSWQNPRRVEDKLWWSQSPGEFGAWNQEEDPDGIC